MSLTWTLYGLGISLKAKLEFPLSPLSRIKLLSDFLVFYPLFAENYSF